MKTFLIAFVVFIVLVLTEYWTAEFSPFLHDVFVGFVFARVGWFIATRLEK